MTTDTLPAHATARAAVTLDGGKVHRDWRHLGAEAAGSSLAAHAFCAIYSAWAGLMAVAWTLAVLAGVSAVACLVFLILMRREGRLWTYAISDDPA